MRKKQASINARIPEELRKEIDRQATRCGLKPSQILQTALERYVDHLAATTLAQLVEQGELRKFPSCTAHS